MTLTDTSITVSSSLVLESTRPEPGQLFFFLRPQIGSRYRSILYTVIMATERCLQSDVVVFLLLCPWVIRGRCSGKLPQSSSFLLHFYNILIFFKKEQYPGRLLCPFLVLVFFFFFLRIIQKMARFNTFYGSLIYGCAIKRPQLGDQSPRCHTALKTLGTRRPPMENVERGGTNGFRN